MNPLALFHVGLAIGTLLRVDGHYRALNPDVRPDLMLALIGDAKAELEKASLLLQEQVPEGGN